MGSGGLKGTQTTSAFQALAKELKAPVAALSREIAADIWNFIETARLRVAQTVNADLVLRVTAYYGVVSFSNKIGMGDTVTVAASGLTVFCQLRNCIRFRAGTRTCIDELGFHMMTPA